MNHISQPSQIEKLIAENIDLKAKLEKLQKEYDRLHEDITQPRCNDCNCILGDNWCADCARETYGDFTVRITEIDGKSCVCTADFRPNRINVAVDKNRVITRIIGIG